MIEHEILFHRLLLISEILNNDNNGKIKEMTGGGVEDDSRYLIRYWDTINIPVGDQWAGAGTTHFATAHV